MDNQENTSAPAGRNRETVLLVVVGVLGLAGLALLQFARQEPPARPEERTLVQTQQGQDPNAAALSTKPPVYGRLVRTSEQPEAGMPFLFRLETFNQGGEYQLDPGDGTRKTFVNGVLEHTYAKAGTFPVVLYARYENEEVQVDNLTKTVQVAHKPEQIEVAPFIESNN